MSKEWIDELKKLFFSPNHNDVDVPSAVDLKLKHIPQRLFKYRTFGKYSLDNLKNNTLWCCKASQFNDPYDSYKLLFRSLSGKSLELVILRSLQDFSRVKLYCFFCFLLQHHYPHLYLPRQQH